MNESLTDVENLALIDQQCALNELLDQRNLTLAEYELVRRVIQQTGDWDYQSLLYFTKGSLSNAGMALANKNPIVIDVLMVEAGIKPFLETTFVNPVYCAQSLISRRQKDKSSLATSLEILAQRYPEAIFIIGQDQECLTTLLTLIETKMIQPSLLLVTASCFKEAKEIKERLKDSLLPLITVDGTKGNAVVAVGVFNSLVTLTWQLYEQNDYNLSYINNFLQKI